MESQTLELCLTLPAPFAFIEGEPEWQGSVLSLGGTEALRLDGLDSSVTIGGTSVSERELTLTLERSGSDLDSLDLTLTVPGTALRTLRPAVNLLLAAPADTQKEAGGEVELTLTLTSGGSTVTSRSSLWLSTVQDIEPTAWQAEYRQNIFWVDNNDELHNRPSTGSFTAPQLAFRITPKDGTPSGDFTVLTEENMGDLGLDALPRPTIKDLSTGGWEYIFEGNSKGLPSEIRVTDIYGDATDYTVEWQVTPQENDGYYLRPVTQEEIDGDTIDSVSQPGWYYVLKRDLTFNMVLRVGTIPSTEESRKALLNKVLDNFRFTAFWNVGDEQKTQISILRTMESYVQITEDNDNLTLTVAGVWKYNLDGSLITYKVDQLPESEGGTTPGRLPLENMGEDYLAITYDNSNVPNFGSIEDALYSGGTLNLTLTGSTEYEAYKVWMDSGTEEAIKARPDGTFQLWRYRKGQDFDTASPLRNALGTLVEVKVDTDPQPDETGVARQHISFTVDFNGDGRADDSLLPKYDPEGYEYIYCVKEVTLSKAGSNHYKQVFGELQDDDTLLDRIEVNGSIVEDTEGKRPAGNAYLYNGGTLSNCIDANITTRVTKTWDAASFQSELEDVRVELKLQSRPKDSYEPWEDTRLPAVTMDEFYSEQLTQISSQSVPQYDMLGRELEYRWVECGVYQGKSEENLLRDNGTFTLQQNGYSVNYQSSSVQQDGSSTLITNTLDNTIDYQVAKDWQDEQGQPMQAPAGETVTLQIFQGLPGEPLDPDPYVEITLDGVADPAPTVVNADLGITVQETEPWKGEVRNLPEFDSSGRQYEYYLLEEGDGVSRFPIYETERTEDGGYQTRVINVPTGAGNRIMVRKVWIDDSDTTHRLPVTIQAYAKEDNKAISSVTLQDGVWYGYIGIGSYTADEVYILETRVGDKPVPLTTYYLNSGASPNYTQPEAPAEYDPDGTYTAIQYETEYHRYEATYSRDTIAGTEFLTVTNRRLGNIDLTVTKQWLDGEGSVRKELLAELEKTRANSDPASQLYLAIRLDFVGGEDYYEITRNGLGEADTVTVGNPDNQVAIRDQNGKPASSLQIVSLEPEDSTREYAFHNLPKYDRSGQVVHYTAVEVWVDGSGRELSRTELARRFPDAYALIRSYSTGYSDEKYLVDEHRDSDIQTMTVTNRLSGTKSVLWHKQWKDTYNYENGLRPDIYLDIYQVTHVRDNQGNPTTQVSLYQADYHWTYLEDDVWNGDQLLSPIYHWHAVFSSLPKYDSLGYEIYYYAVENTHVNASDFDYEDTALAYPFGGANTTPSRIGTQSGMDNGIPQNGEGVDTAVLIPDGLANAGKYALLEDGTFTNTASANVTVLGQKLWKTMPASYPAADLPEVTFTLQQTLGTETRDIATLTIRNWNLPLENGAYHFGFAYTGENVVSMNADDTLRIDPAPGNENAQPLPKYDENGQRYTYTLKETAITLKNGTNSKLVYLDPVINTYLVENSYRSIQGALSVKKFLELPTDEKGTPTAYPAVQFTLDRRYIKNDGTPSGWEKDVQTVTWTSEKVEAAYQANSGNKLLEQVLTFENLDYYAPNGSRWEYRIREVTDGWLGGYEITAVAGNADSTDVIDTIYKAEGILAADDAITLNKDEGRGGTADNVAVAASFYNKPDDTRETVTLEFDKVWDDFGNAFRTRPDELTLTVLRQAHSQEGQDNAILPPTEVPDTAYEIQVQKDGNTWHYTITGKVDGELERYAPNGMPWVYGIQEVKPSGYESASGGETWTTGDPDENGVLTAGDLTNSITQTVYYQKQWLNSDGTAVTEDYLGTEITVTFQLQVRIDTASQWENADTFFQNAFPDKYDDIFDGYDFTPKLTGRINDSTVWGKNHALINLPRFISDGQGGTTQLSYRVVETGISWDGGSPITVTVTEDSKDSWKYEFSGNGLFSPVQETLSLPSDSTFIVKNQLNTTSITVRKEWDGDQGNAYGTRPTTGRDDYNWEVSLLVQYSSDGDSDNDKDWTTLTARTPSVADPDAFVETPVILHIYGKNTDASGEASLSGLPAYDLKGNPLTYRVRELQPNAEDDTWWYSQLRDIAVAKVEAAIVGNNKTFHHNYTANYTADNGTLVAKNTYGSMLQFTAKKTWHGAPAASLPLELQYLAVENGKKVWKSFPTPATVKLDGTAGPNPNPYYENTPADSAVWTAVWEKVPTVVPGSVTDADGKTRYRIAETVPDGYQTVDGSPTWQEVTADNPEATFTNVKSTSLTVEKKWGTALSSTSLPSITVQLYASTNPDDAKAGRADAGLIVLGQTKTLTGTSKTWTATFTGLPLYNEAGDQLYYYALETQIGGQTPIKAVDGCYRVTIGSKEYHFRFSFDTTTTGSYKTTLVNVEYSDITGTKTWEDNSDAYGTRPDGITLALYRKAGTGAEEVVNGADGKPLQPTWVKSGNTWTYTYTHLPEADDQGAVYTYRVEEIQTTGPAGGDQYTATQNGMNLTNTLTGTVNLQVEKLWQDNDNALGLRPDEIIVELCVNGSPDPTRALTLTAANDWKGSFDGLAKYDSNGALIRYSVREESQSMPLGYRVYYGEAVTGTPESSEEPVYQFTNVADGAVTLTKKVSGSRGDTSKAFTFTFTLTSGLPSTAPADAYPYTITRQDGTQETGVIRSGETFTLRHNESITISELPGNAAYQFTESDNAGYQVSSTGASGTVLPGSTISASFENYRGGGGGGGHDPDPDPDPRHDHPTPSPDPELPYTGQDWRTVGLLSAGGVILLSLGLFRRRKDHEPSQPE